MTHTKDSAREQVLYMAMELSKRWWKLGFGVNARRCSKVSVQAGALGDLLAQISKAKRRFALADSARVLSCYEAGRDGFWIHRALASHQIENVVVDPASIEVNRRRRRAKTDRLDVERLLKGLVTYHEHDRDTWAVVRVPSAAAEDERRVHRELDRLTKERTGHRARIQALLATVGVERKPTKDFVQWLEHAQAWDGRALPSALRSELGCEYVRLQLVEQQMDALRAEMEQRIEQPQTKADEQAKRLQELVAIGPLGSWILAKELLAWRAFSNRKQVGAIVGLTPTPFDSGDSEREQGISKAGNWRVRKLMTQLAWTWLRHQPDSRISRWYADKFAAGASRARRVGIIAVARRLLVALWRWADQGVVPDGARLRPPAK